MRVVVIPSVLLHQEKNTTKDVCKIWEKKRQPDRSPETLDSRPRPSSTNIHDTKICDNKWEKNKRSWNVRGKKQQESNEVKWNESKNQSKKAKKTQQEQQEKHWQLKRKKEGGPKEEGNERSFRSECRENRTCCCCCCCPRAYIPVLAGSWISAGSGQVIRLSSGLVWSGQVIRLSSRVVWSGQVFGRIQVFFLKFALGTSIGHIHTTPTYFQYWIRGEKFSMIRRSYPPIHRGWGDRPSIVLSRYTASDFERKYAFVLSGICSALPASDSNEDNFPRTYDTCYLARNSRICFPSPTPRHIRRTMKPNRTKVTPPVSDDNWPCMHARQVLSMFFGVLLFLGFVLYSRRYCIFPWKEERKW